MQNLPGFIIIGAMKSATTTLQDQLVQQPGIFMSDPKEPNFFSDDEQFAKGMDWYHGLFDTFPETGLLGEASTHYTKLPTYPDTISRIKAHLPDARFIYVMRHPVDRLISHYIHEWSMGVYSCDIDEAIEQYSELVDYSRYAMQLEPYIETFAHDQVLPVFFDRLIKHPQSELERVCEFIGYENQPEWHQDLKAKNVSSKRIRRFPLYNLLIDSRLATFLRRNLIPKQLRNAVKARLRMQDRPVISESMLAELEIRFNQDLVMLSQQLNLDKELNCQNFKDVTSSESLDWVRKNV